MRTVKFEHEGRTYHLCMNAAALFDIYDHFGSDKTVLENIVGTSKEALENTCRMLSILAEHGELLRRWQGMEPQELPTAEMFLALITPSDFPRAQAAIIQAVEIGFGREVPDSDTPEYTDLGLLELQKKTKPASIAATISRWLRNFWAWVCGTPSS